MLMCSNISGIVDVNAADQKGDVSRSFMSVTSSHRSGKLTGTLVHKNVCTLRAYLSDAGGIEHIVSSILGTTYTLVGKGRDGKGDRERETRVVFQRRERFNDARKYSCI